MTSLHRHTKNALIKGIDALYKPFRTWMPLQTFRYIIAGLANSGLDIALFSIFYNFVFRARMVDLGIVTITPHIAAFLLAFCITCLTGYYLNRHILFEDAGLSRKAQFFRVMLVYITSAVLTYLILKLLIDYLDFYPTPSKVAATIFTSCFSYVTQTYFYFRKSR